MSIKRAQFFGSVEVESNLTYLAQQRRLQRIKDVREQEKRISMTRSEKYRECINERKAIKTSAIRQCKVEKLETVKQELVYQWQSALVNTGHAHRGAIEETKRRRIEKNSEERHIHQLNEVARQRELAALRLRQQQILDMQQHSVEIRELKKVRDELRQSEREDAHEAGVSFATRQKMLDNERAWREYHTNGHSVKDETRKIIQSAVSVEQRFPVKVRARVLRHGTGPRDMKMIINSASDEEAALMKRMWNSVMVELINKKVILSRAKTAMVKVTSERGAQFLEDELKLLEAVDKANARMTRVVSADGIFDVDEENLKLKNRFEHIFMSRAIDIRPTNPTRAPASSAAPKDVSIQSHARVPQPSLHVPKPIAAAPSPKWTVLRSVSDAQRQQQQARRAENDVFQMFPATVEDDCDSCVSSALSNASEEDSLNYPPVVQHRAAAAPVPPVMQKRPPSTFSPPGQQPQPSVGLPPSAAAPGKSAVVPTLALNLQKSPPPTILVDFTPRDISNGDSGDKANLSGVINGSWLAEQVDVLSKKNRHKKHLPHASASSASSAPVDEPLPQRPTTARAAKAAKASAASAPGAVAAPPSDLSGASAVAARLLSPSLSRKTSNSSPLLPAPINIPHLASFTSVDSRNLSEGSDDTPVARHDTQVLSPHPVRRLDSHIVAATPAAGHRHHSSFGSGSGGSSSSGSDVAGWRQTNVNLSTSEGSSNRSVSSQGSSHVVSPDRSSYLVEQSLNSTTLSAVMQGSTSQRRVDSAQSTSSSGSEGRVKAPTTPYRGSGGAQTNPFQMSSNESSAIVSPAESPFRPSQSAIASVHDLNHPSQRVANVAVDASLDSTMTADSISGLYISSSAAAVTAVRGNQYSRTAFVGGTSSSGAIVFDDSSEASPEEDQLPEDESSLYADYQQLNEMLSQSALTEPSFSPPVAATSRGVSQLPTLIKAPILPSASTTAAIRGTAAAQNLGSWSVVRSVDESIDSPNYSLRSSDSSFAFNEQLSRQSIPVALAGGMDDSFGGLSLASSQSSVVFPRDSRVSSTVAAGSRSTAIAYGSAATGDDSFLSGGDLSVASGSTESSVVYPKESLTTTASVTATAGARTTSQVHSSGSVSSTDSGIRSPPEQRVGHGLLTSTPLTNYSLVSGSSAGVPAVSSSSGIYGTSILTVNSLSRSPQHQEGGKHGSRSGSSSGSSSVVIPGIAVNDTDEYEESDVDENGDEDASDGYLSEQSLDSLT